ncbi:MAG TPA: hypothetical protein VIQ05_02695, partial [Tardiphaga sp.]
MTQAFPRFRGLRAARLQRGVVAVLCTQLLLGACQAKSIELRAGTSGGEPMPPPVQATRMPAPQWPGDAVVRTVPNFQAPSATHCARPIQTREVLSDRGPQAMPAAPSPRGRTLHRGEPRASSAADVHETEKATADSGSAMREKVAPTPPVPAPIALPQAAPPAMRNTARAVEPGAPVTAGMVDDNADFGEYLRFRERTQVAHRARDVRERHLLQVRNARGTVVPDAEVAVTAPS